MPDHARIIESLLKAAGAALSAEHRETAKKDLTGASKSMVDSMSEAQLEDLAHTKRDELPEKKGD